MDGLTPDTYYTLGGRNRRDQLNLDFDQSLTVDNEMDPKLAFFIVSSIVLDNFST